MAEKEKVCKVCGYLSKEKVCVKCGNNSFLEKYKGVVVVLKPEESEVAAKLGIKEGGKFAMKYG